MNKIKFLKFLNEDDACSEAINYLAEAKNLKDAYDNCPNGDWLYYLIKTIDQNKNNIIDLILAIHKGVGVKYNDTDNRVLYTYHKKGLGYSYYKTYGYCPANISNPFYDVYKILIGQSPIITLRLMHNAILDSDNTETWENAAEIIKEIYSYNRLQSLLRRYDG